MATYTYCYHACPPGEGLSYASEQMSFAHRYRNDLARLEHDRRAACEKLLRERCPALVEADAAVVAAEQAVEAIVKAAKRVNAEMRRRTSASDPAVRQQLRDARAKLREARATQKALRLAAYADGTLKADLDKIADENREALKRLRGSSGLHWGTYQFVEEAASEFHKGPPPSFRRWDGGGTVCVHFQGDPVFVRDLVSGHSFARLTPPGAKARYNTQKGYRAAGRALDGPEERTLAHLSLRVGSARQPGKKPAPIWCEVSFVMHRPLPPAARVSWVRLKRSRYGTAERWQVQFVITLPDPDAVIPRPPGVVAVDLGWRLVDGDLRVATWFGSDGRGGEEHLPAALLQEDALPDRLKSFRSLHFDGMRSVLAAWLAADDVPQYVIKHLDWLRQEETKAVLDVQAGGEHRWLKNRKKALFYLTPERHAWEELFHGWEACRRVGRGDVPEWLREDAKTLAYWRSAGRMAVLVRRWSAERFANDDRIFAALSVWLSRDKHLCDWEAFTSLHVRRARLDRYRKLAARLRREYGAVVLENVNWREMMARADVDEIEQAGTRVYMRVAAVGSLAKALTEEFGSAFTHRVPAEDTTCTCHRCLNLCDWDQSKHVSHTCEHCGAHWDQDANAAKNLLRLYGEQETDGDGEQAPDERKSSSRRNRRAKKIEAIE